jgi:hypothetical protein
MVVFFIRVSCTAQVEEQITPSELKQKTIVTEPQTLYKGFFRAGLAYNYGALDKIFNDKGKKESLPSNIWANSAFLQLFLVYGITDRLQAEVRIPYRSDQVYQSFVYEFPDFDSVGVAKWHNKSSGLGDLAFSVGYQLLTEKLTTPSITGYLSVQLPTGEKNPTKIKNDREYKQPMGSGEVSIDAGLRLRKIRYPFVYTINASFTYFNGGKKLLDPAETEEKNFRSGSNFSVGGALNFHVNDWIAVRNFLDYYLSKADTYDGETEKNDSWVIQYYPGLSFQVKRFRIDQAVTIPLTGKLSAADPGYILILQYTF